MKALLLSALLLASILVARPAAAEEPASEDAPSAVEERSAAFRAVSGPETESVSGGPLLIGAYLALWGLTLGYLLRLGKIARGIEADVESLRQALQKVDDDVR